MQKLLFVCNDFIGTTMAGPGIRSWEMAHALERKGHHASILSRHVEQGFTGDSIITVGKSSFSNLFTRILRSDCIIQAGSPLAIFLSILFRKKLIFDQYDPVIFEFLERKPLSWRGRFQKRAMLLLWKVRQRIILRFGDGFLVANDKQKDFLIGQLAILGHIRKLDAVVIVPFGLPTAKPVKTRLVLRGIKIKDSDFLLVWGGGIWDWFDPFTLLRAIEKISKKRSDIKVYFPGIMPPSPDSQKMAVTKTFLDEVRSLNLMDSTVFINTGWTAYEDRANYLLEADVGISLHRDSMETRFAFRTRMLDYLWAELPVIASKGDSWADIIEKREMGITVLPGDIDSVADAIMQMADDKSSRIRCREHVRSVAMEYQWDELVSRLKIQ